VLDSITLLTSMAAISRFLGSIRLTDVWHRVEGLIFPFSEAPTGLPNDHVWRTCIPVRLYWP